MNRKLGKKFEELLARAGDPGSGQLIAGAAPAVRPARSAALKSTAKKTSTLPSAKTATGTKRYAKAASKVSRATAGKKSPGRGGPSTRRG